MRHGWQGHKPSNTKRTAHRELESARKNIKKKATEKTEGKWQNPALLNSNAGAQNQRKTRKKEEKAGTKGRRGGEVSGNKTRGANRRSSSWKEGAKILARVFEHKHEKRGGTFRAR